MFYDDEKTTELELPKQTPPPAAAPAKLDEGVVEIGSTPAPTPTPKAKPLVESRRSNIVHVDFPASARLRKPARRDDAAMPEPAPVVHMARQQHWANKIDLQTSWVLRLLAVVIVVALSFLIL